MACLASGGPHYLLLRCMYACPHAPAYLPCCRYVKFDTYHPAVDRGLPVTRVISRTLLQQILAEAAMELAGENVIQNGVHVVNYKEARVLDTALRGL